jgi:diaminobutyrate-2-oxoglutarate transaminase
MYDELTHAKVRTPIPGPRSMSALERQRQVESSAVSYPKRLPVAVRRGAGSYIEDLDGNVFLDFLTGAGSLPLGHCHPRVVKAAQLQMEVFCHGLDFPSEPKARFIEALHAALPPGLADEYKLHFCAPTGADAIEAAIKLCKLYTGGDEVISFQGGYHGCTNGAGSLTGLRTVKMRLGGRMPGVHFFPYSSCHACPLGLSRDGCATNCIGLLERALDDPNSGLGKPAAVLLELVQGEGGVVPADLEFAQRLRALTLRHDIPLVVDEIQAGWGRTGKWFSFEHYGIEPDVFTVSKGLSGLGLPVAVIYYRKKMNVWPSGAHIGTFRGNQVAFAAGAEAAAILREEGILANVTARGAQLHDGLSQLAQKYPWMRPPRGLGLMLGFDVVDPRTGKPSPRIATRFQTLALRNGLMLELGGRDDTVVRVLPPLNIGEESVAEALQIVAQVCAEVNRWVGTAELAEFDYSI